MKVLFNTFSPIAFSNRQSSSSHVTKTNSMENDMFVKSLSNVAFTSKSGEDDKNDLLSALIAIGLVGAPFLTAIAVGSYCGKHMDSTDIFLSDGTYYGDVNDFKVETPNVKADAIEGSVNFKGTPIKIEPDKYDFVDVDNGIYKNYDGSVDIDLLHNKYIDLNNGVIIDPVNKISAMEIDGVMTNIVVPDIASPAFNGASMSNWHAQRIEPSRDEYIIQHGGKAPEDNVSEQFMSEVDKLDLNRRIAYPSDNRSVMRKVLDYMNPFSDNHYAIHKYDKSKVYDVFGREVVEIKKADGTLMKVGLDEQMVETLKKFDLKEDSLGELSDFFDKTKLDKYLTEYHPACNLEVTGTDVSEFLNKFIDEHHDVAEIVAKDTVQQVFDAANENDWSFLDIFRHLACQY